MLKPFHLILALFFSSSLIAGDGFFYYAWSVNYQYKSVNCKNAFVKYGNNTNNFYGSSYEQSRADAIFKTHNVGFNIEAVTKKGFVQASTNFLRIAGTLKDSVDTRGFAGEPVQLRMAIGPRIGNLGIHIGVYGRMIRNGLISSNYESTNGYYFGSPGNWGLHYFDKLYTWEGGILLNTVYQINETTGLRASIGAGKIKNKERRIDGSGKEIEAKFYKTFKDTKNVGFYVSYRFNSYEIKGINENVVGNGNSGSIRQPATKWVQNTFVIGINIPIVFNG